MKVLLDTHALLWFLYGDTQLGPNARSTIESAPCVLSDLSLFEISLKVSKGKLVVKSSLGNAARELGFERTGIDDRYLARMERLPRHHGDPFDRFLIAQALVDDLTVLTTDKVFARYGVNVIDART